MDPHHRHLPTNAGHASGERRVAIAGSILAIVVAACGVSSAPPTVVVASPDETAAALSAAPSPASQRAAQTAEPTARPIARNPAQVDGSMPYRPAIDPADFSITIDNPFMPLVPGSTFIYEGEGERIEVTVTSDTRTVMGVETRVIRDTASVDGTVIEDTFDWFAQDRAGNVWYFGEDTKAFEHDPAGDPAGSWEAGVDGAQPGIVMLADPLGGDVYRQEYLAGEAEDLALVRQLDGSITVRAGAYDHVLITEEWTPLDPKNIEHKFYAKGVGLVGERKVVGGNEQVDLVEVRIGGG
jgi:hypothetical protein